MKQREQKQIDSTYLKSRMRQLSIFELLYGAIWGSFAFTTAYLKTAGMSSVQIGDLMMINSFLGIIAPPFWGLVADKFKSRKKIFNILMFLMGLTFVLVPYSTTLSLLGVSMIFFMLPLHNLFRLPTNSLLDTMIVAEADETPGMDYSSIRLWASIGYSVISVAYSAIMKTGLVGLSFPFYMMGIFTLFAIGMSRALKDVSTEELVQQEQNVPKQKLAPGRLLKDYYFMTFLVVSICVFSQSGAIQYLNYLIEDVGGNVENIGLISGIKTVLEITVLLLAPRLKKRFTLPTIYLMGGISYTLELFLYPFCTNQWNILFVQMLGGIGFGLILGAAINYVAVLAPVELGATATALYGAMQSVSGMITSFFAGRLIEVVGVKVFFALIGSVVGGSLIIFVLSFVIGIKVLKKEPPQRLGLVKNEGIDTL